ncbi:MAG: hypothetical protein KJ732_07245 [Candidatus Margulisbacteria bacterium]|nr:hypothetical protein [Candidatus Margulisiibacteriota bacterium]
MVNVNLNALELELGDAIDLRIAEPLMNFVDVDSVGGGSTDPDIAGADIPAGTDTSVIDEAGVYTTIDGMTVDMGSVKGTIAIGNFNANTDNIVAGLSGVQESRKGAETQVGRAFRTAG